MSSVIDYKQKYLDLKARFMETVDAAFRMGFEQGQTQAQMDQFAQAQAQQVEAQQQIQGQGALGTPPGEEQQKDPNAGKMYDAENPLGTEIDKHIAELESVIHGNMDKSELIKSLESLKNLREMKKSEESVKGIVKALHRPEFKLGLQATKNMTSNQKDSLSMQHKIVNDILQKWEDQEKEAQKQINSILEIEGLLKKDE